MSSGSFSKLSLDHFDFWSSWRYLQSAAITEDRKELPAAKERRRNGSAGEWNGGIQVHCYTFWVLLNCFLSDLQGFLKPITGRNLKIFWAGPTFSLELAAWNHKREDVEWTAGASTGGTTQEIRCGSMIFTLQSWSYTGHFRFIQIPGVQGHITEHLHRWARHGLQVVKHNRLWEWNSTKRCGTCRLVDLNPRPIDDRGSTLITLGNSEQTLTSAVHFFFKSILNSECLKKFDVGLTLRPTQFMSMCIVATVKDRQRLMEETLNRWHQLLEGLTLCCLEKAWLKLFPFGNRIRDKFA